MQNQPLRKVTAFVTRGQSGERQVLLFRHPTTGVQVPAGTVDPDEPFDDAVLREAHEETGLNNLAIAEYLGERVYELPANHYVALRRVTLADRPDPEARGANWHLGPGYQAQAIDEANGFLRVVYTSRSINDPSLTRRASRDGCPHRS